MKLKQKAACYAPAAKVLLNIYEPRDLRQRGVTWVGIPHTKRPLALWKPEVSRTALGDTIYAWTHASKVEAVCAVAATAAPLGTTTTIAVHYNKEKLTHGTCFTCGIFGELFLTFIFSHPLEGLFLMASRGKRKREEKEKKSKVSAGIFDPGGGS